MPEIQTVKHVSEEMWNSTCYVCLPNPPLRCQVFDMLRYIVPVVWYTRNELPYMFSDFCEQLENCWVKPDPIFYARIYIFSSWVYTVLFGCVPLMADFRMKPADGRRPSPCLLYMLYEARYGDRTKIILLERNPRVISLRFVGVYARRHVTLTGSINICSYT